MTIYISDGKINEMVTDRTDVTMLLLPSNRMYDTGFQFEYQYLTPISFKGQNQAHLDCEYRRNDKESTMYC